MKFDKFGNVDHYDGNLFDQNSVLDRTRAIRDAQHKEGYIKY